MKPVSFERACSIDDEITVPETSTGGFHFSVGFKVDGSERVHTQLAAREQGMAARRGRSLVSGSGAALRA